MGFCKQCKEYVVEPREYCGVACDLRAQLAAAVERAEKAERERDEAIAENNKMSCAFCGHKRWTREDCTACDRDRLAGEVERARRAIQDFLAWENTPGADDRTTQLGLADWLEQTERLAAIAYPVQPAQGAQGEAPADAKGGEA